MKTANTERAAKNLAMTQEKSNFGRDGRGKDRVWVRNQVGGSGISSSENTND